MKRFFYDGYGFMRIWFFALLLVLFVVALCAGIVGVTILADRHDCPPRSDLAQQASEQADCPN